MINELVQTEKSYVRNLKSVVESFKLPLQQNRILSPQELSAIFVNIDDIIAINARFLR